MTGPVAREPALWEARLVGVLAAALSVFGIAAVYGSSSITAVQLGHSGWMFALRQLGGVMIGLILLIVAARTDYHVWQRLAWPLLGASAALVIVPVMPGMGDLVREVNGARRWIDLGVVSLQPSEVAKFTVVAWAAALAARKGDTIREFRRGLLPFLVIITPISFLVLIEPDFSTAALLFLLVGLVLFAAGARIGHFLLVVVIAVPLAWREIMSAPYRLARLLTFLSPGADLTEASWQITQSLIGIGAGGFAGVGFGQGLQKLGYLPYAHSDFLFSTIGEEWGFIGASFIILLFALYVMMGFRIARTAPDRFGMLLATGLTALIGVSAFLHIAVTVALVPTTGLTLPFLSYGRSSLLISLVATGAIINIGARRPGAGRGNEAAP